MRKMITIKKTPAQLNREIAEALSGKRSRGVRSRGVRSRGVRSRGVRSRGVRSYAAHATKKDYDWASFVDGAAFAFWASPYMSEVASLADESREAYRALSPGSGGKWDDVMPKAPPAAIAVAKKFTKAVKETLTDEQLDEVSSKFSAHDAGYYGAMQSQGEGVGWFDEGVKVDPPRGFDYDPKIQNAIARALAKGARDAGVKLPRR